MFSSTSHLYRFGWNCLNIRQPSGSALFFLSIVHFLFSGLLAFSLCCCDIVLGLLLCFPFAISPVYLLDFHKILVTTEWKPPTCYAPPVGLLLSEFAILFVYAKVVQNETIDFYRGKSELLLPWQLLGMLGFYQVN